MSNKVELNEKEMDIVMGGIGFSNIYGTIGVDIDHQDYHYRNLDACYQYFLAHQSEGDQKIIEGMLKEGLIY